MSIKIGLTNDILVISNTLLTFATEPGLSKKINEKLLQLVAVSQSVPVSCGANSFRGDCNYYWIRENPNHRDTLLVYGTRLTSQLVRDRIQLAELEPNAKDIG